MSFKASQLLDGQLDREDVERALEELGADPDARDRYTVYGLVGDVLRGNPTPYDGFSRRIFERMQRERARMEPGFDPLKD